MFLHVLNLGQQDSSIIGHRISRDCPYGFVGVDKFHKGIGDIQYGDQWLLHYYTS